MTGSLPRVVFVDDDAAIRRLVASVLEDLPIDLVCCASVAEARAALRAQAAQLVITDLMLPVETGFDLLESLAADAALRAGAHLVVFSAGLHADTRARLTGLGVWRQLSKPVSLQALEDCVSDALALPPGTGTVAPTLVPTEAPNDAPNDAPVANPAHLRDHEQHAIVAQFGGDAALYLAFRSQVQLQLPLDIHEGERLLTEADWPALHRLSHSLKGLLSLLGDEPGAALARHLEASAAAAAAVADGAACHQGWPALVRHLRGSGLA